MPLACPQPSSDENSAATSEDCLSMVLYVPTSGMSMPTMMWYVPSNPLTPKSATPG